MPTDPARDCYELNIADPETSPFFTGSFVGRPKRDRVFAQRRLAVLRSVGPARAFRRKGRWSAGARLHRSRAARPRPHWPATQQGGRRVSQHQAQAAWLESIFNGRDLAGWKVFPGKKSVFSVTSDGDLNVKKGNGQLETERQWADFVLQLDIFSNGKYLNSGIFFRCVPDQFWQGYECQIQNGFLLDRARPMDYGTGGIYGRQKARRGRAATISSGFTRRWSCRATTWPPGSTGFRSATLSTIGPRTKTPAMASDSKPAP